MKPPLLIPAPLDVLNVNCDHCKFMNMTTGGCKKYDEYPVKRWQWCLAWMRRRKGG